MDIESYIERSLAEKEPPNDPLALIQRTANPINPEQRGVADVFLQSNMAIRPSAPIPDLDGILNSTSEAPSAGQRYNQQLKQK